MAHRLPAGIRPAAFARNEVRPLPVKRLFVVEQSAPNQVDITRRAEHRTDRDHSLLAEKIGFDTEVGREQKLCPDTKVYAPVLQCIDGEAGNIPLTGKQALLHERHHFVKKGAFL